MILWWCCCLEPFEERWRLEAQAQVMIMIHGDAPQPHMVLILILIFQEFFDPEFCRDLSRKFWLEKGKGRLVCQQSMQVVVEFLGLFQVLGGPRCFGVLLLFLSAACGLEGSHTLARVGAFLYITVCWCMRCRELRCSHRCAPWSWSLVGHYLISLNHWKFLAS